MNVPKLCKDLRLGLLKVAQLRSLITAQATALEQVRADLKAIRVELRMHVRACECLGTRIQDARCTRCLPGCDAHDSCTSFVPTLEDVAAGAGGASASVGLLAAVSAGATWPPVAELGMVGLLRDGPNGQVRGLTEAELARWLHATGMGLITAGEGLVAHSRQADLCATVTHLGRFAQ